MGVLKVHFLPDLVREEDFAGASVVVIDVLRATTTITYALAAGAREVVPCLEVEDARRAAARLPHGHAVLGGERGGLRIEGFDLGNSPAEYTTATVGGRTLVFTTTNGTRAMMRCREARSVYLGAFVNRTAILRALAAEPNVHLLCSGTRGEITREDVLFAGAVVDGLSGADALPRDRNDQATIAGDAWRAAVPCSSKDDRAAWREVLVRVLHASQGGRNLNREGLAGDIPAAAEIDRFDFAPTLDLTAWTIRKPA